jgi:Cu+-exporting ATPase
VLTYSKNVLAGVGWGFALSLVFNAIALTLAVMGLLNPMVAALLMPASSLTVVLFSIGLVKKANLTFDKEALTY